MSNYQLPVNYTNLTALQRKQVREQYIQLQHNNCMYCGCSLNDKAPAFITEKKLTLSLFPPYFFRYPIHLQHNHTTGFTEGAVHSYCNAVMYEYEGR